MERKKKKRQLGAFTVLMLIVIFCALLTWFIPGGTFERAIDAASGREVVVPGSFQYAESNPVTIWSFFTNIFEGLMNAADIIFFLFFAGSYVYLVVQTGALNAAVGALMRKIGHRESVFIPIFMILFAIGGTSFGMTEETYGLIPAFVAVMVSLGYDRIAGGSIIYVAVSTGFAAAITNPFTIGIASQIAGVPLVEPKILFVRVLAFVLFTALSITYVMRYAIRVKKDPSKSLVYNDGVEMGDLASKDEILNMEFTRQHKLSLIGFAVVIFFIVLGVIKWGFYLSELSAIFFIAFLVTAFLNRYSAEEMGNLFVEGAKGMVFAALIIGLARSISIMLTNSNTIDNVVFYLSEMVKGLPTSMTAIGMLIVQNIINFFIPSGSGQAAAVLPIMAPLADLTGVTRQVAVLAYQFGDGFSNLFWPTLAAVGAGLMNVGLDKWYKFITPLFAMMFVLQCVLILFAVAIGV